MIINFVFLGSISYQVLIYKTHNINYVFIVKYFKVFDLVAKNHFMSTQGSR